MTFASPRRADAGINLTPLIDILFIVLLFLVLTATFSERTRLQIALPKAETGERVANSPDRLAILVDAEGNVYLEDEARTLEEIGRRLRALPNKDGTTVALSADEEARHGRVIQVVDTIRQADIVRLDIETFSSVGSRRPNATP